LIIKHRVNTIKELNEIPTKYGVEIDLRLSMGQLVLAHDPFKNGDKFELWLEHFQHKTLILNVKEDGLEERIVEILKGKGVLDYFFLDQPFPTLRKSVYAGFPVAIRLSEYENPINLDDLKIDWIWLDSFKGDWSYLDKYSVWLRSGKYKVCIVSPELQGRQVEDEPSRIIEYLKLSSITPNAVCTKKPANWERFGL
jgi:hypothetical protein